MCVWVKNVLYLKHWVNTELSRNYVIDMGTKVHLIHENGETKYIVA